ncbi:hypothetical protein BpHYR1_029914 [Brachionus plicatilis]|uniref:Uncharacterized protein n=1 Tax=Brachionus plicatilis TaxID=10195 RepID=A0A3M7SVE6_BRAPC|nr:hypothetical protein BpHYR1_029914 [Brachionus plicatilis]
MKINWTKHVKSVRQKLKVLELRSQLCMKERKIWDRYKAKIQIVCANRRINFFTSKIKIKINFSKKLINISNWRTALNDCDPSFLSHFLRRLTMYGSRLGSLISRPSPPREAKALLYGAACVEHVEHCLHCSTSHKARQPVHF